MNVEELYQKYCKWCIYRLMKDLENDMYSNWDNNVMKQRGLLAEKKCKTAMLEIEKIYKNGIGEITTSLGCINATPAYNMPCKQEEKGSVMNDYQPLDIQQKNYLSSRANDIFYNKKVELKAQFGLTDQPAPKTAAEFADRIKNGQYVIDDKDRGYFEWYSAIRWRNPKTAEDKTGYNAARVELDKALQAVKDLIVVSEPKDALEALKAFEAQTF